MNKTKELVKSIVNKAGHDFYEFKKKIFNSEFLDFIMISRKNNFDYFIFLSLPCNKLEVMNDSIQIDIHSTILSIKSELPSFGTLENFDKNSTLIILTEFPEDTDQDTIYKEITFVEEDNYFFKKQIINYKKSDFTSIDNILSSDNCIKYCNDFILNEEYYESFIKGESNEYEFIARLFEKLPFLTLEIKNEKLVTLRDSIKLSEKEREFLDVLFLKEDEDEIVKWVNSLEVIND